MHLGMIRIAPHGYHIMVGGANHPVNDVGPINRSNQKILRNWIIICAVINLNLGKRFGFIPTASRLFPINTPVHPTHHPAPPAPTYKNSWTIKRTARCVRRTSRRISAAAGPFMCLTLSMIDRERKERRIVAGFTPSDHLRDGGCRLSLLQPGYQPATSPPSLGCVKLHVGNAANIRARFSQ